MHHSWPRLCGSSLDVEFIRECMKINKISPKFHFFFTVRVLLFTVSLLVEPFGSRDVLSAFKILSCYTNSKK